MSNLPIILASASPARLELLSRIGIHPIVLPANIDESEYKRELPFEVASRLSKAKAEAVALTSENGYIIAADSVAAVGRRIMPKALTPEMVADCLRAFSGRRHSLYTGVHIIKKTAERMESRHRVVKTVIKFKNLSTDEIDLYVNLGEGLNKAGGYSIQGYAQSYVSFISGSFSNIIGLPLYETRNMLTSLGCK